MVSQEVRGLTSMTRMTVKKLAKKAAAVYLRWPMK